MNTFTVSRVGRSVLGLIAVTLLGLTTISAQATVTRKWAYDVPRPSPETAQSGSQLRSDGAGGIIVLFDTGVPGEDLTRKLIWFNEHGSVLVETEVGPSAEITAAFKDRCYLVNEFDPEGIEAVRIVYRNGTSDLTIGSYGLGNEQFSDLGVPNLSAPFTSDGFFSFEYYLNPGDEEGTIVRLRIAYYTAKKN